MYLKKPGIPKPLPAILRRSIIRMALLGVAPSAIATLFTMKRHDYDAWLKTSRVGQEIRRRQRQRFNINDVQMALVVDLAILNISYVRTARLLGTTMAKFYKWLCTSGTREEVEQALHDRNTMIVHRAVSRGWSVARLARAFFLPTSTLEPILASDPAYVARQSRRRRRRQLRNERIRQARRQGESCAPIARRERVSEALVRVLCRGIRVEPPMLSSKPQPLSDLNRAVIKWRRREHLACLIADFLDISRAAVYAALNNGHQRRVRGSLVPRIRQLYANPPWDALIAHHLQCPPQDIASILQHREGAA